MKNFLILAWILFVVSINISAQTKNDKAAAAIRSVMDAQVKAWNAGDIEGFMSGYWKSDDLTFVSGTNVTKGWQSTLDRYKKSYDTRAKMGVLTFSDLEIEVIAKDAAKVLGSWSVQTEKANPKGKFTLVFKRFKEGWRIIHDHTS